MKRCSQCKTRKPLDDFYAGASSCKPCYRQVQWRSVLKRRYGLTEDQHAAMLAAQEGRCAICRELPPLTRGLVIDHDHETGRVRGLLCNNCNAALGCFRDNPEAISRAIGYLAKDRESIALRPEILERHLRHA